MESVEIKIKIGITAKSWNNKIPMDNFPCLVFKSNLSIKIFETIAVEDIVTAAPTTNPSTKLNPTNIASMVDIKSVIPTCVKPTPKRIFLIEFNVGKLNSRPIVNIKKTIPNSTRCLLDSESAKTENPLGPKIRPTRK